MHLSATMLGKVEAGDASEAGRQNLEEKRDKTGEENDKQV